MVTVLGGDFSFANIDWGCDFSLPSALMEVLAEDESEAGELFFFAGFSFLPAGAFFSEDLSVLFRSELRRLVKLFLELERRLDRLPLPP